MKLEQQLIIDVSELLLHPGSTKKASFGEKVEGLELDLARVEPTDPVRFELTLESLEDGIFVRARLRGRSVVTCRRCLEESRQEFVYNAAELYRPRTDVWEEGYVISDEHIDLRPLVRDTVLLNMPMYPLCDEGCRGLCSRCGANLNTGPCTCPPEEGDLRWSALRELLRDQ